MFEGNSRKFLNYIEHSWTEVLKYVKEALVFMDDPSAECLHFNGDLKRILDSGAISVENFSPFVKADSKIKKVVFVLASPLIGETWKTISVILRVNNFDSCVVFSSLPPRCHHDESDAINPIFPSLERQLCNWMQNKNCVTTVRYIPLLPAYISQRIFIMPAFSKQFSVFKCGLTEMNIKRTDEISIKSIPEDVQTSVKHFSYSLYSLLETFQVKGDFFSLGPLSHLVSSELLTLSQQQKKSHPSKASVVIIDRLLDLAGPLSQTYETILDRILLAMPHMPGHTFDVCVPMNDLATCSNSCVFGRPLLAPGCIAHKNNTWEDSAFNTILYKKPRESLIEMNRSIVECAAKEGINLDLNSRLTPDVLKHRVLAFKERPKSIMKCCGLLQQVLATVQAMEYSASNSVDNLSAIEKALLEYLATSPEEVLNNIMQMISERQEMNYKMEDILIFLAFFYMLSDDSNAANESAMQATLMEEFFHDRNMNELLNLFVDGEHEDEYVLNTVRTLFDVLKRLGSMRKRFKKYLTLFKSTNPAFPASYNSLLKQLIQDIFDGTLADIPDIEYHSTGLRDYIKTGFSLFMNVSKPQPRDNPTIFIILLGGVTASEIKLIQEKTAQLKEHEVILGCTSIVTPRDTLKDLGLIVKELMNENYEDEL